MKGKTWFWVVAVLLVSLMLPLGQVALADDSTTPPVTARPQPLVRFQGVIASRPQDKEGVWTIDERQVNVTKDTILDETVGPAVVGATVNVLARRLPVTDTNAVELEAILIRVLPPPVPRPVTIRGYVTELTDTYLVVDEQKILYDRSTQIHGRLEVGVFVTVHAIQMADGYKALAIFVLPDNGRIIEFEGVIKDMTSPQWTIGDRKVTVEPCPAVPNPPGPNVRQCTRIIGQPAVGKLAKVRALVQSNGELFALTIWVRNVEPKEEVWTGIIERLPQQITVRFPPSYVGVWVVGGRSVMVTRETKIEGTPRIGLSARVQALYDPRQRQPGAHLVAQKIEILNASPTGTPVPTATPET